MWQALGSKGYQTTYLSKIGVPSPIKTLWVQYSARTKYSYSTPASRGGMSRAHAEGLEALILWERDKKRT